MADYLLFERDRKAAKALIQLCAQQVGTRPELWVPGTGHDLGYTHVLDRGHHVPAQLHEVSFRCKHLTLLGVLLAASLDVSETHGAVPARNALLDVQRKLAESTEVGSPGRYAEALRTWGRAADQATVLYHLRLVACSY